MLKGRLVELEEGEGGALSTTQITGDDAIEDLQTELKVWQEKYNYLKETMEHPEMLPHSSEESSELILDLQNKTIELEAKVGNFKSKYTDALILAEKAINELKKRSR